jgi:nucleotide-binding universal stress UspA family protein
MHHSDLAPVPLRYASILVSVDLTAACEARLKLAVDLSDRFESRLIGCSAQPVVAPLYFEVAGAEVATVTEIEERRAINDLSKAKDRFIRAVGASSRAEWRQDLTFATDFIVQQARAADLIITNRPYSDEAGSVEPNVDAGDLLMRAGRPALFVPPDIDHVSAKRIIVGWKDTREARRAVFDALPLLTRSTEVTVLSVGSDDQGAKDVAVYLGCHGIAAFAVNRAVAEAKAADELLRFAEDEGADLIVCGGYGRSRAREWIFGGVTRDLLDHAKLCCLMTH